MLRIHLVLTVAVVLTASITNANVKTFGREVVAVFPHAQHKKTLGGCTDCHGSKVPGPIDKLSKSWAHATCVGCHSENKSGPVECVGCHIM